MSTTPEDMAEAGLTIMALIKRAQEEGVDTDAYDAVMEKGLTEEQEYIADRFAGDGRVHVDEAKIPNLLDKLEAGAKLPWMFKLDGVWFPVKAKYGEGSYPHSKWDWREDGYKFVFYKARRDDCVHGVSIRRVED